MNVVICLSQYRRQGGTSGTTEVLRNLGGGCFRPLAHQDDYRARGFQPQAHARVCSVSGTGVGGSCGQRQQSLAERSEADALPYRGYQCGEQRSARDARSVRAVLRRHRLSSAGIRCVRAGFPSASDRSFRGDHHQRQQDTLYGPQESRLQEGRLSRFDRRLHGDQEGVLSNRCGPSRGLGRDRHRGK